MKEDLFAASLGSRGVLHPGPLLWLRALGWLVLLIVLMFAAAFAVSFVPGDEDPNDGLPGLLDALLTAAATLALYVAAVWVGERRWPTELDPRALPQLLGGLAIGGAIMWRSTGVSSTRRAATP